MRHSPSKSKKGRALARRTAAKAFLGNDLRTFVARQQATDGGLGIPDARDSYWRRVYPFRCHYYGTRRAAINVERHIRTGKRRARTQEREYLRQRDAFFRDLARNRLTVVSLTPTDVVAYRFGPRVYRHLSIHVEARR